MCSTSLQIARELTISLANNRFGLFPMKWQETLDPPKRSDETDLIPNEVSLISHLHAPVTRNWTLCHTDSPDLLHVQWDKPGSQIVGMSTEFSELFTREVTKVRTSSVSL